jgi:hypothetical protein
MEAGVEPFTPLTGEEVIPVPPWVPRVIGWLLVVAGTVCALLTVVFLVPMTFHDVARATVQIEFVAPIVMLLFGILVSSGVTFFGVRLLRGAKKDAG